MAIMLAIRQLAYNEGWNAAGAADPQLGEYIETPPQWQEVKSLEIAFICGKIDRFLLSVKKNRG